MSLEAIAALLGHRSRSMTRVYACLADRIGERPPLLGELRVNQCRDGSRLSGSDSVFRTSKALGDSCPLGRAHSLAGRQCKPFRTLWQEEGRPGLAA